MTPPLIQTELMHHYRVKLRVYLVNDSYMDVPITVQAESPKKIRARITPDWVMRNVNNDWGPPILSVTVERVRRLK